MVFLDKKLIIHKYPQKIVKLYGGTTYIYI
jgi:hypothetical protein